MRIHKTKYAYLTNDELLNRAEQCVTLLSCYPLIAEIVERFKETPEPNCISLELIERQPSLL